jgi:predicted 3-demethylubiquinone-9 3-methyltransferase (glyoxalase superfamily)
MQKIIPFLWFDNQAVEAVSFYTSIFSNSKIEGAIDLKERPVPNTDVMTISFQLAGQEFMALNGGPQYAFTPAVSFFVDCQTRDEIDQLWTHLIEGGRALMELGEHPFSERFGWLMDRYGVSWQFNLSGTPQKITPYFLFVGEQHGKAEAAMKFYTSLFPNSSIRQIERFGAGMGETEGTVMHGRFVLAGHDFMAMDSGLEHKFTFSPAISFMIHCDNQAEVDHFWENLAQGGEKEMCGWLRDRYGVSWQVVPTALMSMLSDSDPERVKKVSQALLQMQKIDISQLEEAFEPG